MLKTVVRRPPVLASLIALVLFAPRAQAQTLFQPFVKSVVPTSSSLTISWNPNFAAQDWLVQWSAQDPNVTNPQYTKSATNLGQVSSYTITGLPANLTQYIRLTPIIRSPSYSAGPSYWFWAATLAAGATAPAPVPLAVPAVVQGTPTATTIPISWPAVAGANSYEVEWGFDMTMISQGQIMRVQNGTTSYTFTNLQPGFGLYCRVTALSFSPTYAIGATSPWLQLRPYVTPTPTVTRTPTPTPTRTP